MPEPIVVHLYEARNVLRGKWPGLLRAAAWTFVFGFGFMMLVENFADVQVFPHLRWSFGAHFFSNPSQWWRALYGGLICGGLLAVMVAAMMMAYVRLHSFLIYPDKVRLKAGVLALDIPFSSITGVEAVTLPAWPALKTFWPDLKRQLQLVCAPRYQRYGIAQVMRSRMAKLVLIKCSGRRWWNGFLLDMDDPEQFMAMLERAREQYHAAQTGAPANTRMAS